MSKQESEAAITPKLKRFAERYFETLDPQGSAEYTGALLGRLHVTPYEWLKQLDHMDNEGNTTEVWQ